MKNLLILVDAIGRRKESFFQLISERISGSDIKVTLAKFSELTFDLDGKNISVKLNNKDIRDFDLVYYRRVGNKFFSLGGTLAICLNHFKIPFYDTCFLDVGPDEDKFTNLTRLALAGLPIIPTFFCWHTEIERYKNDIIKKLGLPLVVKWLASHRGEGVSLVKDAKDFESIQKQGEEKDFLFQKYLEGSCEYRLLVLKDRVAVAEEKIRTDPNEFRSNVALGAKEKFLNVNEVSEEIRDMAVKAAKTLKIQTAGVDVMIEKANQKAWLLEVNRGPGLTYDTKVSPEIDEIANFFKRELKKDNATN